MPEIDNAALHRLIATVLWGAFGLGVVFGAIAQRTHFCTMGAISDVVNMGDWTRVRMWVLAVGVAMVGFNAMVALGWLHAADSVYARPQLIWLSNALGGALFGFGMVLASGCGSKTLVRLGGGSLKALVVFCVLGIASYATLRGMAAVARVETVDRVMVELPVGQDLPSLLGHAAGWPVPTLAAVLGVGGGLVLSAWALWPRDARNADNLLAGLGLGGVIVAVWWLSGRVGFVAEHPQTLEPVFVATNTRSMESFTFVAPVAYAIDWVILFSDASKRLTMGIASVFGVVVGSFLAAVAGGRFRWEGFVSTEDTANHVVGGALMGVGGVTAFGCTVGQGMTGLSTLSLGSVIAVAGIVAGAVAAIRYQAWRLDRQG